MGIFSRKPGSAPPTKTLIRSINRSSSNNGIASHNPTSSTNGEAPPVYQALQPGQTYVRSPIDENDLVELALEDSCTAEPFLFRKKKLQQRGCAGLLKLVTEYEKRMPRGPMVFGDKCENAVTYNHEYTPKAMAVFAEWVDTGNLRPIIHHVSAISPALDIYHLLYILSTILANETLCNAIIEELLAWYAACNMVPTAKNASNVSKMVSGSLPEPLENFYVYYLAWHPEALEKRLGVVGGWENLGALQKPLMKVLAQKCQNKAVYVPSTKTRCGLHIHKETQPCKDSGSEGVYTPGY